MQELKINKEVRKHSIISILIVLLITFIFTILLTPIETPTGLGTGEILIGMVNYCDTTIDTNITLSENLSCSNSGININASNIVLDCNDYSIIGDSYGTDVDYGINIENYNNITIIDCDVHGFTKGINAVNVSILNITGGNYSDNGPDQDTDNDNDGFNLFLDNVDDFTINNIIISNPTESLAGGGGGGGPGGSAYGIRVDKSTSGRINNITGNANNYDIGGSVYGLFIKDGLKINVTNSNLGPNWTVGINYENSTYGFISYNTIISKSESILLTESSFINITNNNFNSTGSYTIFFDESTNNYVINNNVTANLDNAIYLFSKAHNNTISKNNFTSRRSEAVHVRYSEDNTFSNNKIRANDTGILIETVAERNIFRNNNITATTSDIIKDTTGASRTNSLIYNNSFGEVNWFDKADLSIVENGTIGLGTAINISGNLIQVSSENYNNNDSSGLNQSANITLYNTNSLVGSGNRTILRNGIDCPSSICTELQDADTYIFNVTGFTNYSITGTCGGIISESKILEDNLICPTAGINIGASNIVLDCAGFNITYSVNGSSGYGVYNTGFDNVTVKNCNIIEGNTTTDYKQGINILNAENSSVINNTITTSGSVAHGIVYSNSSLNNVFNNTITTTGLVAYGIQLDNSSNSLIINNSINTNGTLGGIGIMLLANSDLNNIINNSITTGGASHGIYLWGNAFNNVTRNIINTTGTGNGLYLFKNSVGNVFSDNIILESGGSGIALDSSSGLYPENNTFVNNSFSNVATYDFYIQDVGINGSWLVDQPLSSYFINESIVYFKDSSYGMVEFLEGINGSGSNLSGDVFIGSNLISVNSSQSGLNKSANLTLYNITSLVGSGNRKILRDGVDCPSSICTELADDDTFLFSVTGFTDYSLGLVSSGGSSSTSSSSYSTTTVTTTNQTICNNDGVCDVNETSDNCPADCIISDTVIVEVCNNDGVCDVDETSDNCPADCMVEELKNISMEVFLESEMVFDTLRFTIVLSIIEPKDGLFEYLIITNTDTILIIEQEKLYIENKTIEREIELPENIAPSDYKLLIKLTIGEETVFEELSFNLGSTEQPTFFGTEKENYFMYFIISIILLLIILALFEIFPRKDPK